MEAGSLLVWAVASAAAAMSDEEELPPLLPGEEAPLWVGDRLS